MSAVAVSLTIAPRPRRGWQPEDGWPDPPRCRACDAVLTWESANRNSRMRGGRATICLPCHRAAAAARRATRPAGSCVRCCIRPAVAGFTMCVECRARDAARVADGRVAEDKRRLRARRIAAGFCADCGVAPLATARHCAEHAAEHAERQSSRLRRRALSHWSEVLDDSGARCVVSSERQDWSGDGSGTESSVDHVLAREHGGSNDPENLQPMSRSLNSSKNDRPIREWIVGAISAVDSERGDPDRSSALRRWLHHTPTVAVADPAADLAAWAAEALG